MILKKLNISRPSHPYITFLHTLLDAFYSTVTTKKLFPDKGYAIKPRF